ncbi:helix-turn-helix domain-containing protein [Litorivivens sp.]|uniref:helix-turn-helix domain-containing protein n=1 Tax=Litorivivens sp. TaxID=2020868 RepID=UPI00356962CF
MIESEDQVTRDWATALRSELGVSQKEFWAPGDVSPAMIVKYEKGEHEISRRVRRLMFIHYVIGIDLSGNLNTAKAIAAKHKAAKASMGEIVAQFNEIQRVTHRLSLAVNRITNELEA